MPRKSAAALAVFSPSGIPSRLSPPSHLGARESALFLDLVLSLPSAHFQPSDLPLLCRFVECTALAEQAAAALADNGAVVDGKPSPWIAIHGQMVKALIGLSLKLRLNPQARQPNTPRRRVHASYYERMQLEGQ